MSGYVNNFLYSQLDLINTPRYKDASQLYTLFTFYVYTEIAAYIYIPWITQARTISKLATSIFKVKNEIIYKDTLSHTEKNLLVNFTIFIKKIHYFFSDAGTHSKSRIFTILNSAFCDGRKNNKNYYFK